MRKLVCLRAPEPPMDLLLFCLSKEPSLWTEQTNYQMKRDFGTPYLKGRYGSGVLDVECNSRLRWTEQSNNLSTLSKTAEFWEV
jgi:hypothetical protein